MSNTQEFSIIQSYYNIVWSAECIRQLKKIIGDDFVLHYRAIDDSSKDFDKQGDAAFKFYQDWAAIADRPGTHIHKFSVNMAFDEFIIHYIIIQTHGSTKYKLEFDEFIKIKNMKISQIRLHRISKEIISE
jgi:hypothetical protein